jgi:glycosyltransferase involved in cell wall biosynthesis
VQDVKVSVVVPVYRSEKTLETLFLRTKALFDNLGQTFEMVLVEDCGGDNSWQEILKLKSRFPELVKGIRLSRNSGQHNAVLCGFAHAKGNLVVTLDDDLQTPPEEIKKLLQKYEESGADLVYGIYEKKQHNTWRNLGSNLFKRTAGRALKTAAEGSSFRLLKASLVWMLLTHKQADIFIDGLVRWHTSNIAYQVVAHEKRKSGQSGYSFFRLLGLAFTLFFNFTLIPVRIITLMGSIIFAGSLFWGLVLIFRALVYDDSPDYMAAVVSVFFVGGLLLTGLGLTGEYLGRILLQQNGKPQYSIGEVI